LYTHTQTSTSPQTSKEVVVNVHAAQTTTSKPQGTSILLLVLSESQYHLKSQNREQTDCACVFKFNCSNLPATPVEEGIREIAPSSFKISFPAEPSSTQRMLVFLRQRQHQHPRNAQHTQKPRIPTLNVTHTNIERHARTRANSPRNTNQNNKQRPEHTQKSLTFTTKKFFRPNVHPSIRP